MTAVTLAVVGDVMLGDDGFLIGRGVRSQVEQRGCDYPFARCAELLCSTDLSFCNLECVLSDAGLDPSSLRSRALRGSPHCGAAIARAGFGVASVANNHIHDHGHAAFSETVNSLSSHGVTVVGTWRRRQQKQTCVVAETSTLRLGFLAYSLVGLNDTLEASVAQMLVDVMRTERTVDATVVSLHWGDEYVRIPAPWQIACAHDLVDAGADLIVGHHPHVLQPIEQYRGGLIAYSLGNFVCDMQWGATADSAILVVELDESGYRRHVLRLAHINGCYQPELSPGCQTIRRPGGPTSEERAFSGRTGIASDSHAYRKARMWARVQYRLHLTAIAARALLRYPWSWKVQLVRAAVRRRLLGHVVVPR